MKSSLSEAVLQRLRFDMSPGTMQQVDGVEKIEFEVGLGIDGGNSTAKEQLAVVDFQILNNALIHWLTWELEICNC